MYSLWYVCFRRSYWILPCQRIFLPGDMCKFIWKRLLWHSHDSHNFYMILITAALFILSSNAWGHGFTFARLANKNSPEASRSSWSTTFGSPRRSTSTGTSLWSPCGGPWRPPASVCAETASWSRAPCCASRAARTTAGELVAAPCGWLETSTSVGSSTFGTPAPRMRVDPWAEVVLFICSVDIRVLSCEDAGKEWKRWLDSKLPKGLSWLWIRTPLR